MMSKEEQKKKITKGWFFVLLVNLVLFNSPAGDCGGDMATGFPTVLGMYAGYPQKVFSFSPLALGIDILTAFVLVLIFAKKIVGYVKLHVGALKATIVYFSLTNIICVFSYAVNLNTAAYESLLFPFLLFYLPGIYLSKLNFNHAIPLTDEFYVFARLGLLPSLVLSYFVFYFLAWGFCKIKKSQNLPDTNK